MAGAADVAVPGFDVHLDCFTGPFDVLLSLVARRRLDVTEVALAAVTDEFVAHLRQLQALEALDAAAGDAALERASGFVVVAATLLELKAARLLPPTGEPEDDAATAALLEARDLLFARLLQHRAYAEVAAALGERLAAGGLSAPLVPPEDRDLDAAAQVAAQRATRTTTPQHLAQLARAALGAPAPAPPAPRVSTEHLHRPAVRVGEQVALLADRLRAAGGAVAFADLVAAAAADGAGGRAVVVGRFVAVLELYRRGLVDVEQPEPLRGLLVRWCGPVAP